MKSEIIDEAAFDAALGHGLVRNSFVNARQLHKARGGRKRPLGY